MPVYGWKCRLCGRTADNMDNTIPPICECSMPMVRDYKTVQLPRGQSAFQPHFNYSVGQHVSNMREFKDALSQRSEENSLRTGIDHNYQPLLPGDMPAPTTSTDILETRNRLVHDQKRTDMQVVE